MSTSKLDQIDHFVVIMLENRSFDHILGFLYADQPPRDNQPFDGLTGEEYNLNKDGEKVQVHQLSASDPYCYFTPRADPGEGFSATSSQLYENHNVVQQTTPPNNGGFVTNYQYTLSWEPGAGYTIYKGASEQGIMAMHTPETLPVLSTLAREYAVCDRWFCSAPTETQPNRAFMHLATSEGRIKNNWDEPFSTTSPCIFESLQNAGASWSIFAYQDTHKQLQMARFDIPWLLKQSDDHFGAFSDFKSKAAAGTLANYSFLEPDWGPTGNSMHPNYNAANAEQFIKEIYETLVNSPKWDKTMLIITFDEHGGCYDHVAPPANATPPDDIKAYNGFDFSRFGVRVPTILVSPYIQSETVYRIDDGSGVNSAPLDHTSILKTLELRFGAKALTRRDAAAPHIAGVLSLDEARTDNVLENIAAPSAKLPPDSAENDKSSELQRGMAKQVSRYPDPDKDWDHKPYEYHHWNDGDEMMKWAADRWDRYRHYQSN